MFLTQTPSLVMAEVHTTMPDIFRKTGVRSKWADANRGGTPVDSFIEGPVFDQMGNLYITDIPFGRIFKIDPLNNWTLITEYDGEPNGMKFLSERILLVTDYKNGLMRINIDDGTVEPYLERRNSESFRGLNDLTIDSKGNIYFTDQGQSGMHQPNGCVYRLAPDGRLDILLNNVPSPNGIVLSPDEKVMFIAVTRGNCVWRAPLMSDGSVTKVGQFFTSYGPSGPDGLAIDELGNLIVANPGLGYVWHLNHRAEPIQIYSSPLGTSVTNLAFGGVEGKTIFCTESVTGSILSVNMPNRGCLVHSSARHSNLN